MKFPDPIHNDGKPIKTISPAEMSWIFIKNLWPSRHKSEVRHCIKRHTASIRRWSPRA